MSFYEEIHYFNTVSVAHCLTARLPKRLGEGSLVKAKKGRQSLKLKNSLGIPGRYDLCPHARRIFQESSFPSLSPSRAAYLAVSVTNALACVRRNRRAKRKRKRKNKETEECGSGRERVEEGGRREWMAA
jgi:hypothetical protein